MELFPEVLVRDLDPQGVDWGGIVSTEVLVRDLGPQGWTEVELFPKVLVKDLGSQGWSKVELFPKVLVRDLGPQGWTEVELFPKVLVRDLGPGGGGNWGGIVSTAVMVRDLGRFHRGGPRWSYFQRYWLGTWVPRG